MTTGRHRTGSEGIPTSRVNVSFILVEPLHPDNVGAAARAIKTMGFSDLRLVNPCDHLGERALGVAHMSQEVLRKAHVFTSLQEAISDCDFTIATTAKKRHVRFDHYECSEVLGLIESKADTIKRVGIVFGREKYGLTNDEVGLCDITSGVTLRCRHPSLNLSHAVMIYAHHLSPLAGPLQRRRRESAPDGEFRALKKEVGALLEGLGLPSAGGFHARVMERLGALGKEDVHILHALSRRVKREISVR